jgi:hypothetical protein
LTSWKLGVICSNEPLKQDYIKLENPFLFSHQSNLLWHHHKEKYQQFRIVVQTYAPPNPNAHKDDATILSL